VVCPLRLQTARNRLAWVAVGKVPEIEVNELVALPPEVLVNKVLIVPPEHVALDPPTQVPEQS